MFNEEKKLTPEQDKIANTWRVLYTIFVISYVLSIGSIYFFPNAQFHIYLALLSVVFFILQIIYSVKHRFFGNLTMSGFHKEFMTTRKQYIEYALGTILLVLVMGLVYYAIIFTL